MSDGFSSQTAVQESSDKTTNEKKRSISQADPENVNAKVLPQRRRSRRTGFGTTTEEQREKATQESLTELAELIVTGKKVVFLTGAGISVASGIKPFRGQDDAVWHESVLEWGTRAKFKENAFDWYNTFWLRHFDEAEKDNFKPNKGHAAIANLCNSYPDTIHVITQNIDGLHKLDKNRLIEVHGTATRYKCIESGCLYSEKEDFVPPSGLDVVKNGSRSYLRGEEAIPRCPECKAKCLPNCLLFDEDYSSHVEYRFQEAQDWLEDADAIVFVGTSFSVQITGIALQFANLSANKRVFDFNIKPHTVPRSKVNRVTIQYVLGPSEDTLEKLRELCLN